MILRDFTADIGIAIRVSTNISVYLFALARDAKMLSSLAKRVPGASNSSMLPLFSTIILS